MWQYGKGVAQCYKKAIELYNLAVTKGNFFALNNLVCFLSLDAHFFVARIVYLESLFLFSIRL